MSKIIHIFCALTLVTLVYACSDSPLSKEDQIRQYIDTAVTAAESRNYNDLANLVDDDYHDQKALNRPQLVKLLKLYFFRHKNIFLLTKIGDISFPGEDQAKVSLHVAMAGSVISDTNALSSLRARIYRFDLELVMADGWVLREASWQVASVTDIQ